MPDKKISYQELIRKEYKQCLESPVYFMKHYVKIKHPIRGTILFDLFDFQEETLKAFHDYKFNIILKSRQMGISTLVAAYALWMMTFFNDKTVLLISLKQDDAKDIVTKVRDAYTELPSWIKVQCTEDNRLSMRFKNGSTIKAASTTKKSGVGQALSLLIIDEAALIEDAEELWTSAQPTLSTGGNSIVLSTPRGVGNWFHKMWQGAESENMNNTVGRNGFHPITLPWQLHPERDEEWRRIEGEKQGNPKKASQEYDCNFLASGDNVVDLNIIEFYKKNKAADPKECRGMDKNLWIWEYPDRNHVYVIAADVARGDGADYSACHVLDISREKPVQVAEYKGKIGTKDFGDFLVTLATEYNGCLLVIERENVGWGTIQEVLDRGYANTFYSSADVKYVDVQHQLNNKWASEDRKLVPGFSTNIKTRPMIIDNMEHYMRQMAIEIRSKRTLAELETFIWKNSKPIAMEGYNDDLVMSLCIALYVRDTALRLRQEGVELTKIAIGGITSTKKDTTPFYKVKQQQIGFNSWKMNTGRQGFGKQNQENIEWLL